MRSIAFAVAALVSYVTLMVSIPPLSRAGLVGIDVHKAEKPRIPEMGGIACVAGLGTSLLLSLALVCFTYLGSEIDPTLLLTVLLTVLIVAIIGLVDDLLPLTQASKALLPILASFPLAAMRAGVTEMAFPVLGVIDVGWVYPLILIPIGFTVASNASNMLAGFNGLELGIGIVQIGSLAIIAGVLGESTALLILLAGLGALLGALRFNWLPAKVFVGDVGTLTIGGIVAASAIVGNFEVAGMIVYIPHAADFFLKAYHRFPTTGWSGQLDQDGKLRCPRNGPVSLPQLMMRLFGGLREKNLVLLLIGVEAVFGLAAVLFYVLK